ncbi:MAG: VTT domain-containing protein [Candidatus Gracilibacteria bacterium]|nr:VTT domain-containing protein [Candidatus Gracilibacteria bacterium]
MQEIIDPQTLKLILKHGYLVMFGLMVLEGPIITFIGALIAATTGAFNIVIVIILGILGDIVGDGIYYTIGKTGNIKSFEKKKKQSKMLMALEKFIHVHPFKSLVLIKYTPYMQPPGLMFVGFSKFPLKKYITYSSLLSLPGSIIFGLTGFFAGDSVIKLLPILESPWLAIPFVIIIIGVVFFGFKKMQNVIINNVDLENGEKKEEK